jgi:hypothetical protein
MNPADQGRKQQLLERLDDIAHSLERNGHALALMGLGSTGQATYRLDAYSDLDLFIIVEEGYKNLFLEKLDWLASIRPLAYHFRNTDDGYKILFDDGIFCEFAVLEAAELNNIPYSDARVIWAANPSFATTLPEGNQLPRRPGHQVEWYLGEALTNLYVGLSRYRRGEKLNACRFIQGYAMDRLIELSDYIAQDQQHGRDPFSKTRRYEQRHPNLAPELPNLIQGYDRCVESALAILDFLERRFEVNEAMRAEILNLAQGDED